MATHSSPTQADVYKWNPTHSAPVGQVWYGDAASITFTGTMDFHHDEQMDSSDAGDDTEIIFGKYFNGEQITMVQGTSARFELPAGVQADYWIKIIWQEVSP